MAIVTIDRQPDLTPDMAMELFRKHFGHKYDVYRAEWWLRGAAVKRHFALKKSAFVGVTVRLQQESAKTSFIVTAFVPSILAAATLGIWLLLFRRSSYKAMEAEVISFIQQVNEFS